jgi:hypothetical protein
MMLTVESEVKHAIMKSLLGILRFQDAAMSGGGLKLSGDSGRQ